MNYQVVILILGALFAMTAYALEPQNQGAVVNAESQQRGKLRFNTAPGASEAAKKRLSSPKLNQPVVHPAGQQNQMRNKTRTWGNQGDHHRSRNRFPQNNTTIWYGVQEFVPAPSYVVFPSDFDTSYSTYTSSSSSDMQSVDGAWSQAQNGEVPDGAIVKANINGKTVYYCRAQYMGSLIEGMLVPDDGCYIQAGTVTMHFANYEVKIGQ